LERYGKYELIRKLATGGMAEVFLSKAAGPMGFEKLVVLKRILPHLAEDPAFVQRFLAEAKLAARLNHPNVVQIFDLGEHDGGYFIAMEYIDGPSLRTICRKAGKERIYLPPALCAKLVSAACEGLAYAHDFKDPQTGKWVGIIHRDVSPENIIVSQTGSVKVVDFGLAKASEESHTKSKVLLGKYWYMAPEQLRQKEKLDRRVDVYALGVVLYELLTSGERPFDAPSEMEVMRAILAERYVLASKHRRDLPLALERILEKTICRRELRYADCHALQSDLEQYILSTNTPLGAQQISRILLEEGLLQVEGDGEVSGESKGLERPAPKQVTTHSTPPPITPSTTDDGKAYRGNVTLEIEYSGSFVGQSGDAPPLAHSYDGQFTGNTESDELALSENEDGNEDTVQATHQEKPLPPRLPPPPREPSSARLRTVKPKTIEDSQDGGGVTLSSGGEVSNDDVPTRAAPPPRATLPAESHTRALERPKRVARGTLLWAAGGIVLLLVILGMVGWVFFRQAPEQVKQGPSRVSGALTSPAVPRPPEVITPLPSPTMPEPSAKAAASQSLPEPMNSQPEAVPGRSRTARVEIRTEPPADVRINGVLIGRAPVTLGERPAGMVKVEISDKQRGFRREFEITLKEGDNGTMTLAAARVPVQIKVRPRANVTVDELELGRITGDRHLELYEGKHMIRLTNRELNKDVQKEILVVSGEQNIFNFELRR